ncbi:MAG TPA: hypothetical protein VI524_13660 [Anaerolineales bacterium]|nr:hypothetical protein [Anaerolineales bacterium]
MLRRGAHASSSGFALRSPCGDFAARGATPRNDILILFFLVLTACTPSTPAATPQVVTVYSSFAAQPWLNPLYACAGSFAVISRVDDPASADIILRVGEPQFLASPAFQIDTEEILIATHRQSPVQNLTLAEARALFAGQGDPSVQVWVYASDEDLQVAFDRLVMAGRSVTPSARLAVHPQQMSDTLVKEPDTVGILPRHWKAGDSREVFNAGIVPVLAITQAEPAGEIKNLIGCLQQQ